MSKKQRKILWPVLVVIAIGVGGLVFATTRKDSESKAITKAVSSRPNSPHLQTGTAANDNDYVRSARLWPQLRWHLKTLGDRIEKPGKERITITGTIRRVGDSQALPMALMLEHPGRLRLVIQDGVQQRVITFNGREANGVGAPPNARERELIETLVYDTAEHFLAIQTQGAATRMLGQRFRADDGTTANYAGPYYDLYEVSDQIKAAPDARIQSKIFCFDSDSLLLQKVRYQILRNGAPVEVETRISNWQSAQGQQIPRRITRFENNEAVLTLTITSLAITPRIDDGSFGQL
jgi:hypothetical protein